MEVDDEKDDVNKFGSVVPSNSPSKDGPYRYFSIKSYIHKCIKKGIAIINRNYTTYR
jgi:hypothetical protein